MELAVVSPGGGGTRGYNCWTTEEEEQLRAGVGKHGLGSWEIIRRDSEFHLLEKRSGVQLKDKWRNLVKFRHITPEVARTLKPKTSGPWSKKHSAAAWRGGAGIKSEGDEELHAATLLALEAAPAAPAAGEPKRSSRRPVAKSRALDDYVETLSELDEMAGDGGDGAVPDEMEGVADAGGDGTGLELTLVVVKAEGYDGADPGGACGAGAPVSPGAGARKRKRRLGEDRRFGIYDQRRYGEGGAGGGAGGSGGGGGARLSRPRAKRMSEDDETDEDDGGYASGRGGGGSKRSGGGGGRGRSKSCGGGGAGDDLEPNEGGGGGGDGSGVNCVCGVTFDDGWLMTECEGCAEWAHVECLTRMNNVMQPGTVRYDLDHYHCVACQLSGLASHPLPPPPPLMNTAPNHYSHHPHAFTHTTAHGAVGGGYGGGYGGGGDGGGGGSGAGPSGSGRASPAVGPGGRSRRVRKANMRYKGEFLSAPLEDFDGHLGGGGRRSDDGSGCSQHSSKSSRDKTNEASTLLLGLAKAGSDPSLHAAAGAAGVGGMGVLGGLGAGAWGGVLGGSGMMGASAAKGRGPRGGILGPKGGPGGGDDFSGPGDQLELFLSNGRSSSRCGMRAASHLAPAIAAQDLARNHPGRTASPATAALAAAAAMAMKQHEAEMMHRSGSADIPHLMSNDPFASLFPAISGGGPGVPDMTLPAPKPLQHPALMRQASQKSLLSMGDGVGGAPGGGGDARAGSPGIPRAPSRPASRNAHSGQHNHHHAQLLASLGLDGRQSPIDVLSALAGAGGGRGRSSPAGGHGGSGSGGSAGGGGMASLRSPLKKASQGGGNGGAAGGAGGLGGGLGSLPSFGLLGDSDQDVSEHSMSAGLIDSLRSDPLLMGFFGSRASTPASHLFIDSLLRATPDILSSASVGSPSAAASAQLQMLGAALQGSGWQQGPATTIASVGTQPGSARAAAVAATAAATSPRASLAAIARLGGVGGAAGGSVCGFGASGAGAAPAWGAPSVSGSGSGGSGLRSGSSIGVSPPGGSFQLPTAASASAPASAPAVAPSSAAAQAAAAAAAQAAQQQLLHELAARRELSHLVGPASIDGLLRDLLRPGTPDAWGLLRGGTPTQGGDALGGLLSMSHDAAAAWLRGGLADTPVPFHHQPDSATAAAAQAQAQAAAAALAPQPAMGGGSSSERGGGGSGGDGDPSVADAAGGGASTSAAATADGGAGDTAPSISDAADAVEAAALPLQQQQEQMAQQQQQQMALHEATDDLADVFPGPHCTTPTLCMRCMVVHAALNNHVDMWGPAAWPRLFSTLTGAAGAAVGPASGPSAPSADTVLRAIRGKTLRSKTYRGLRRGWQVAAASWVKKVHVDRGDKKVGLHATDGRFHIIEDLRPRYIVPDLSQTALRPYVGLYKLGGAAAAADKLDT
ncbi:hypothetical protein FOA52_001415 [Chlamydomonas sp. UWO 241]|nr:hypothetical protein FOA52_001415 [Chlamydomonas sp. UWO 241]